MKRQALDQPFAHQKVTLGSSFTPSSTLLSVRDFAAQVGGSTNCRFNFCFFQQICCVFFSPGFIFFKGILPWKFPSPLASIQWRFASDANLHDLGFRLSEKVTYTGKSGSPMSGLPFPRRMHLKSPTLWNMFFNYPP